ncbi:MAG: AAA family ATPase, partial [Cytophagaceae bacterium]|nr:AAA family ATPase [Cytophagaceae bacterium]
MIKEVKIENFKSIHSLQLELGRVNVLIGANGSGKTNILEGITFGCAATLDILNPQFLSSRGIRFVEPQYFRTGFNSQSKDGLIKVFFRSTENITIQNELFNSNEPFSNWINKGFDFRKTIDEHDLKLRNIQAFFKSFELIEEGTPKGTDIDYELEKILLEQNRIQHTVTLPDELRDFLVYSPENYFLRRFEEELQNSPLGIRGEG